MLSYQAVASVEAQAVGYSARAIAALTEVFAEQQLSPRMISTLSTSGVNQLLTFSSPDNLSQLILGGRQFEYARSAAIPLGEGLIGFDAFCEEAILVLTQALGYVDRTPHRLSTVRDSVLADLTAKELDTITHTILQRPEIYRDKTIFEWGWRAVAQIEHTFAERTEPLNTISTIKRSAIVVAPPPGIDSQNLGDCINITYDINSLPDNAQQRFDKKAIHAFFTRSIEWQAELEKSVLQFLETRQTNE